VHVRVCGVCVCVMYVCDVCMFVCVCVCVYVPIMNAYTYVLCMICVYAMIVCIGIGQNGVCTRLCMLCGCVLCVRVYVCACW